MNAAAMHPIDRLRRSSRCRSGTPPAAEPRPRPRSSASAGSPTRRSVGSSKISSPFAPPRSPTSASSRSCRSSFTFAVLKGFGAYQTFIDGIVRPYLADTFAPNPRATPGDREDPPVRGSDRRVAPRRDRLVVLVYTSISLVSSIEDALNDVFDAKSARPFLRQITDYVRCSEDADPPVRRRHRVRRGPELERDRLLAGAAPARGSASLGFRRSRWWKPFFAMYVILPNVRVRPLSALLGAALAAVGWQVSLVLHVQLQMGVAKYNALYSVLGRARSSSSGRMSRGSSCSSVARSRRVTRTSRWCGSACAEGARIRR